MIRKARDLTQDLVLHLERTEGRGEIVCGGFPAEARALRILGSRTGVSLDTSTLATDEWEWRVNPNAVA